MINQPLADRIRPQNFDEISGQTHLVGKNGIIRKMVERKRISNMIFFGPPGTGKTTVANIVAKQAGIPLYKLNATTASLSDIHKIASETSNVFGSGGVLLYLDEIQYFNRKQQQSLLEYIEDGRIILIASTTENPYVSIYNAILSRCSVFEFKPVKPEEVVFAMKRAMAFLNESTSQNKTASEEVLLYIGKKAGGDVRRCLNILDNVYSVSDDSLEIDSIDSLAPSFTGNFDVNGDVHYDLLSALQKSIRGSDPDAAIFYLAKLLEGGDLLSPCRRLQVIASEDIGAAYPLAAVIVRACVESAKELGLPEASIPLSNAVIMLATAPKSNSAYNAYNAAREDIIAGRGIQPPTHLRSPLFKGYKYPHDYPNNYVKQQYLPDDIANNQYYVFGSNKTESAAKAHFDYIKNPSHKKT